MADQRDITARRLLEGARGEVANARPAVSRPQTRDSLGDPPTTNRVPLPDSSSRPPPPPIPERYDIRESDGGFFLHCDEAPRLRIVINPSLSASESEARAMGERVIFLDGAGNFAPMLDNKARVYNLDHHQGCVRPFTLATCEQALILVLNGLALDEGDWTIYANEPDLDTVFAIWVLLNFRRVPKLSVRSRDILLPMLRLEGAIDANGSELAEYCGLSHRILRETRERLDKLYGLEKKLRSPESWPNVDLRKFTAAMLGEVDRLVYTHKDFHEYTSVEEILGHVEIAERKVAVACRDQAGIYEAERRLKDRWGEQLGIIALEKSEDEGTRHYTIRRVSAVSDFDLDPIYDLLNLLDPVVDGRPEGKRWGGSTEIGGSPRPTGTQIPPAEVLRLIQRAYAPRSVRERLRPWISASVASISLFLFGGLFAMAAALIPEARMGPLRHLTDGGAGLLAFATFTLALGTLLTRRVSQARAWLFGWRRPAGSDWLTLAPVALACALPASVWVPRNVPLEIGPVALAAGVIVVAAIASETWFRGLIHGWFLFPKRVMRVGGPWFASRACLMSTLYYTVSCVAIAVAWRSSDLAPDPGAPIALAITAIAAAIGGVSLGMIRERSLSLWPGVAIQIVGGLMGAGLAISGLV